MDLKTAMMTQPIYKKVCEYQVITLPPGENLGTGDLEYLTEVSEEGWAPVVAYVHSNQLNLLMGRQRKVLKEKDKLVVPKDK